MQYAVLVHVQRTRSIARFNANGGLDTSFGTSSGFTVTPPPTGSLGAFIGGMAIQSNGQIILASENTTLSQGILVRYNANGTVDTTYGTNGNGFVLLQAPGATSTVFATVVIQADNKAVAVGIATIGVQKMLAARYLTNGTLDDSFGPNGNGIATFTNGANGGAAAVDIVRTIQGNGDIVLGGVLSDSLLGLIRLNDSVTVIPNPVSCIAQQIYNLYCSGC